MVMMVNALSDSASRPAPIARAVGCFGALLALPVARLVSARLSKGEPRLVPVLAVHCGTAAFCSRALIRQESAALVVAAVAAVLLAAVVALVTTAR